MKRMQKILSLLLSLVLFASLLPSAALAAEPAELPEPAAVSEPAEDADARETADAPAEPEETGLPEETGTPEETGEPEGAGTSEAAGDAADDAAKEEQPGGQTADAGEPAERAQEQEPEEKTDGELQQTGESREEGRENDDSEEELALSVEQAVEIYVPGAAEGDDVLLDAYARKQLDSYRSSANRMRLRAVRDPAASLTGINSTVYGILKDKVAAVAAGSVSSSVFTISVEELNLEKNSWTAEELGLETLVTEDADGKKTYTAEAMAAVNAQLGFELRRVVNSLQSACPYEMYWYDKTVGTALKSYSFAGNADRIRIAGSMVFTFAVIASYSDETYVDITNADGSLTRYLCGVDGSQGERISKAVANAAAIVAQFEGCSDLEKLKGYRTRICDAVSYDDAALNNGSAYGDPWQIISVFDEDPLTNVVCEGYAKAFQYLCDRTTFSGPVTVYCVTGTMSGGTGAGSHMWDLVRMEDGRIYLVDVTNCDAGSVGYPDGLFLASCSSGSVEDGYAFSVKSKAIRYQYDDKTRAIFSDEELTVSATAYEPPAPRTPGIVTTVDELLEDLANGVTKIRYPGTGSFLVSKDVTIPRGVSFTLAEGTLTVADGAVLTVAAGGSVTAQKAEIAGTMSVGGTLRLTAASAPLSVSGSLTVEKGGSAYFADPAFRRTSRMKTGGGYYNVEHTAADESSLRSACEIAAADKDGAVLHRIYPKAAITLSADLTMPKNSRVIVDAGYSVAPGEGVTLTNIGNLTVYQSFTAPGRIVNSGVLTLAKDVTGTFTGGYTGSGTLRVSNDAEDPFAQVSGLPANVFLTDKDKNGYWLLTLKEFSLRYDANGGSGSLAGRTVRYGETVTLGSEEPTKEGSSFEGWAKTADAAAAEYRPGGSLTVTGDLTLYAVWKLKEFSLRYDANGGSGSIAGRTVRYGETVTLSSEEPTKEGSSFEGWAKTADAAAAEYRPGGSLTVTGDLTLYAVWKLKEFSLRYDANGGSGSIAEQTGRYGVAITLSTEQPTKNGFRFTGWAKAADAAAAECQPGGSLALTENTTLYAVWEEGDVSYAYADSVTFKGELKLNFYLKLSEQVKQDANAYVIINFKNTDTKLKLSAARINAVGGVNCHVFSLPVVAKEMREVATLRLYYGNSNPVPLYVKDKEITGTGYTSSVMSYLQKSQQTSTNPKMVALARAAENYGTAAQLYFGYKADGLTVADEVTAVKLTQLNDFAPVYESEKTSGMELHTASVMFKSDNTLRQYFTLKSGQVIGNYSFTVDSKTATAVYSSANRYYVALPNIAAKDLDTPHAYTVKCGSETYAFRFSALSYAYQILQVSTNNDMVNLAKALYLYNQAANAYFSSLT